jgi:hypothetical protein
MRPITYDDSERSERPPALIVARFGMGCLQPEQCEASVRVEVEAAGREWMCTWHF